jgi:hypothetical protein
MTSPSDTNKSSNPVDSEVGDLEAEGRKLATKAHDVLNEALSKLEDLFGQGKTQLENLFHRAHYQVEQVASMVTADAKEDAGQDVSEVTSDINQDASAAEQAAKDMNNPAAPGSGETPVGETGQASAATLPTETSSSSTTNEN